MFFFFLFRFGGYSFEQSPKHDAYVPKFEAELAQFCEKLVGVISFSTTPQPQRSLIPFSGSSYWLYDLSLCFFHITCSIAGDGLG